MKYILIIFFWLLWVSFTLKAKEQNVFLFTSPPDSLQTEIEPEPSPCQWITLQQQPKPLNYEEVRQAIGYPSIAKEAGIEGEVCCRILVDEYGCYKKHFITKSAHPLLQKEVEKHLKELCFVPATQAKKPIPFWMNVPFRFNLNSK